MRDYHINIFYSDEDGGYIADIPDLEACSVFWQYARRGTQAGQLCQRCLAQGRPC